MATTHRYRTELAWEGSTAGGYRGYTRAHRVVTPPVDGHLDVTADVPFRGDPGLRNPEQLLLAAASSCQLLSFLALAARHGVDVNAYTDHAEAAMPVTREPMRIAEITLRPRIHVPAGTDEGEVRELVEQAHEECFIANTLNAAMTIVPEIVVG